MYSGRRMKGLFLLVGVGAGGCSGHGVEVVIMVVMMRREEERGCV